jgi:hypothetical protein
MPDISEPCFWDHCAECRDGACGDICHQDEEFDWATREWVETTEAPE